MAIKQRRLSEAEIQNFESASEEQVLTYFRSLSGEQAGELFVQLLRSYRDAARIANTIWAMLDYAKKMDGISETNNAPGQVPHVWMISLKASHDRLKEALLLYSPMTSPPTQYAHDYAISLLAGVHDTLCKFPTVPEAAAWVGGYIDKLRNARWYEGGNT